MCYFGGLSITVSSVPGIEERLNQARKANTIQKEYPLIRRKLIVSCFIYFWSLQAPIYRLSEVFIPDQGMLSLGLVFNSRTTFRIKLRDFLFCGAQRFAILFNCARDIYVRCYACIFISYIPSEYVKFWFVSWGSNPTNRAREIHRFYFRRVNDQIKVPWIYCSRLTR